MTDTTQTYLDLDALVPAQVGVKIDGVTHVIQQVSVEIFIENVKLIQAVGETLTPDAEVELIVKLVSKSLPTLGEAGLRKLTLPQLRKLMEYVRKHNGEGDQPASEEGAEENPQTAQ